MGHANWLRTIGTVSVAVIAISSSGCMMSPQHGEWIGSVTDRVLFAGATLFPGQNVVVEAWDFRTQQWEEFDSFHTSGTGQRYVDRNGNWFRWPAVLNNGYIQIPIKYWQLELQHYRWKAIVRARVEGDNQGMFNFEEGCRWPNINLQQQWEDYGHRYGDEPVDYVVLYARL